MGLAAILLTPYWLIQGIRHGKYLSNLSERLGISFPALEKLPAGRMDAIWLHAVSGGEVLAGLAVGERGEERVSGRALGVFPAPPPWEAPGRERVALAAAVVFF